MIPRPSRSLGGAGCRAEIGGTHNMQDSIERVKIDLDEDEIRRLIDAIDHYEAYLHSQQRDETKFQRAARAAQENTGEAVMRRDRVKLPFFNPEGFAFA